MLEVPDIHLVVCRHKKKVIGGLVLECYPCRYAFLRGIFAIPTYENKEIEAELLVYLKKYVDEQLNDPAMTSQKRVTVLLFSVYSDKTFERIRYSSTAEFYYEMAESAQVDLSYIEPFSGSNGYILGIIPTVSSGNIREKLTVSSYFEFLGQLYGYASPDKKEYYLEKLNSQLANMRERKVPIVEFPKLKNPRLQISNASVAFHLMQASEETKHITGNYYCKIFNSYEKDLFSQRYVEDPPYFTKHIDTRQAIINFDEIVQFTSEGREETFIFVNERGQLLSGNELKKKVNVYINHTYFQRTNKIIWTFVFSPVESFTEYEIIQLEKYFMGSQEDLNNSEGQTTDPGISFNYGDGKDFFFKDITALANAMIFDVKFEHLEKPGVPRIRNVTTFMADSILAGAIQIDTHNIGIRMKANLNQSFDSTSEPKEKRVSKTDLPAKWRWRNDVFQYFNSDDASRKDDSGVDKLDALYASNLSLQYALNSFCGIALGIFDFERMSYEEVTDTLVPLASTDSYFLILNKSSITCFCDQNALYANSIKYGIGMNPYIIIPNTVLAYNSFWAKDSGKHVAKNPLEYREGNPDHPRLHLIEKGAKRSTFYFLDKEYIRQKRKLIRYYEETTDILSNGLRSEILNVFQYETEIEIYKAGMEKRGIIEKRTELERTKGGYDDELKKAESQRSNTFSILSIILSIISLTQIYQFVEEICKRLVVSFDSALKVDQKLIENDPRVYLPALVSTLIFFMLFLYLFVRYYRGYHPESVTSR